MPAPGTWLDQVHGADVVVVSRPGEHAGAPVDAAVTTAPGCALVVRTADCVPVALLAAAGVGIVHAGWRGLAGGIIEEAVHVLGELGVAAATVRAEIGPCIRAGCYEFAGPELDAVAGRYGDAVRATTMWGTPSLDLVAGARVALGRAGVDAVDVLGGCTACDTRWFSHRARRDTARQGSFVWLEA